MLKQWCCIISCECISVIQRSRCVSVLCYIGAYWLFICVKRTMLRGQSLKKVVEDNGVLLCGQDLWAILHQRFQMITVSQFMSLNSIVLPSTPDTCLRPSLVSCSTLQYHYTLSQLIVYPTFTYNDNTTSFKVRDFSMTLKKSGFLIRKLPIFLAAIILRKLYIEINWISYILYLSNFIFKNILLTLHWIRSYW